MDYSFDIFRSIRRKRGSKCGRVVVGIPRAITVQQCSLPEQNKRYLCQVPDTGDSPPSQPLSSSAGQQTWPVLANVSTSMTGQHQQRWRPVVCPKGHVVHAFLACDVASFCWAEGDLTFSLSPDAWALPTSQSCPLPQAMTSLPPSFLCRSQGLHVPYSVVCDHRQDCVDGSDETFCQFLPCQWQTQFPCLKKQVRQSSTVS